MDSKVEDVHKKTAQPYSQFQKAGTIQWVSTRYKQVEAPKTCECGKLSKYHSGAAKTWWTHYM